MAPNILFLSETYNLKFQRDILNIIWNYIICPLVLVHINTSARQSSSLIYLGQP